jgi:hypothetical protein
MYTAAPKKTPHANVATIWEITAKTTLVPDPVRYGRLKERDQT